MPSRTPRQHRAMEAAAHGKSKLGIPKKVGQEFADADDKKGARRSARDFDADDAALGKPSIGKALAGAAKKPVPPRPRKRGAK